MKSKTSSILKSSRLNFLYALLMVALLIPASVFSQQVIEIQVSPNILNLQSNGVVVTIHTDIQFSDVDAQTVTLSGVVIQSWKADNGGYFVAKFNMDDVKDIESLEIGEYNTLTLDGIKVSGDDFTGSEDLLVINNVPSGKK